MKVNIINNVNENFVNFTPIYDIIYEVLSEINRELLTIDKELNIVFIDKYGIKELNSNFRGIDSETDVLSFSYDEDEIFGEVVICPEVIRDQAKEYGNTFEEELTYMLIHGILHLAGYDHENDREKAKEMFDLQEKIFNVIKNKYIHRHNSH